MGIVEALQAPVFKYWYPKKWIFATWYNPQLLWILFSFLSNVPLCRYVILGQTAWRSDSEATRDLFVLVTSILQWLVVAKLQHLQISRPTRSREVVAWLGRKPSSSTLNEFEATSALVSYSSTDHRKRCLIAQRPWLSLAVKKVPLWKVNKKKNPQSTTRELVWWPLMKK